MRLRDWLERLEGKLDEVSGVQAKQHTTLELQRVSLEEHIARTEAAEKRLDLMAAEIAPLKTHVAVWAAIAKGVPVAVGLVGGVLGILKALGKL